MSLKECNTSSDCSGDGVIKLCYSANNFKDATFFCECSNYFGWTGEDCDELTSTLHYARTTNFLFILWGLFVLITCIRSITLYLTLKPKNTGKLNPALFVSFYVFIATGCAVVHQCVDMPSFYDPDYFQVLQRGAEEVVDIKYAALSEYTIIGATIFQSFASLQVIVSYLNVLASYESIIPPEKAKLSELKLKRIVTVLVVVFPIAFIFIAVFNFLLGLLAMVLSLSLLIIVTYTLTYMRFISKLHEIFKTEDIKKAGTYQLIRMSFRVNFGGFLGGTVMLGVVFVLTLRQEEIIPVGGFNYILIAVDILNALAFIVFTHTSWYAFTVICCALKMRKQVAWFPGMNSRCTFQPLTDTYYKSPSSPSAHL